MISYNLNDSEVKKAFDIITDISKFWDEDKIENSETKVKINKAGIIWRDINHKPTKNHFQTITVYLKKKSTAEWRLSRKEYYWVMIFKKLRLGL